MERPKLPTLIPANTPYNEAQWTDRSPEALSPAIDDAELNGTITVPHDGGYVAWMRGVFGRGFSISIEGSEIGTVDDEFFAPPGHFARIGEVRLSEGEAGISIRYQEGGFRPGRSGHEEIGPLVLQPEGDEERVRFASPERAEDLCGRRLDWVELVVR